MHISKRGVTMTNLASAKPPGSRGEPVLCMWQGRRGVLTIRYTLAIKYTLAHHTAPACCRSPPPTSVAPWAP